MPKEIVNLSQTEAQALLKMEKFCDEVIKVYHYPDSEGRERLNIPHVSKDRMEKFILDFNGSISNHGKYSCQIRGRQNVVLAHLDVGGPPHRNPDKEIIGIPHLHFYREGSGTTWAVVVSKKEFSNLDFRYQTFFDFMDFCNVVRRPTIQIGFI